MKPAKEKSASPAYLLGIESSGNTCAVGISGDKDLICNFAVNIPNIHSRELAPLIEQAITTAGIEMPQLSAIVLSAGPGSFTGLRIGYSLAKGLAHALNIPIIEVPTLDVWAYQAGVQTNPVMPVIDARRGEIFAAVYEWQNDEMIKIRDDQLLAPGDIKTLSESPLLLTGADAAKLYPLLDEHLPAASKMITPAAAQPEIWSLLTIGYQKFQSREFSDLTTCEPLYMRAFKGVS